MIKEKITNNKKKIFVTVLAIFLLGGGYFSFFAKNDGEELKYETEKVVKGVIQSAIAVDGKIIFDTWNLEFLNSGTVESIEVSLGDVVQKGQVLARSDSSTEDNKVAQSKSDLNSSALDAERLSREGVDYEIKKKAYEAAQEKEDNEDDLYDKYVELYGEDSTQALAQKIKKDSAEAEVKNTKKQMEQVEESYQDAQYQLTKSQLAYTASQEVYSDYEIDSPVDGVVVAQINGTIGSVVGGDKTTTSEPFMVLVDPKSFWFETYVEDIEALKIESDMKAYIELEAYPDEKFEGKVVFVSPVAEVDANDLANYKVIISIVDTDLQFLSDMAGSADLVSSEVRGVLTVSNSAVKNVEGRQTVIIKNGENFEEREIKTGFTNGKKVEVKFGLEVGETVVIVK
ncbi:MAG: efflux RND transporter periplasmic adaptor subunit [Candidatus Moranbacteria bacterium]|nr:efflux RND transporter periplasmic adaptor subunit [Candidatus Moranbacteria bacterium]